MDNFFSNLVVIIGRQRSGTTVFRKMLASDVNILDIGEIFHGEFSKNKLNFFYFLSEQISENPQLLHPGQHQKVFIDFIKYIANIYQGKKVLIDIKYNMLNMIRNSKIGEGVEPFLIEFIKRKKIPVFHVERQNKLRVIVSEKVAIKSSQWQLNPEEQEINTTDKKIKLNPFAIRTILEQEELVSKSVKKMFCDYNHYCEIPYENMFEENSNFNPYIVKLVESTLNHQISIDLAPKIRKQNPESLDQLIQNFVEVKKSLTGTRFENFIKN